MPALLAPALDPRVPRKDVSGWPIIPPTPLTVHRMSPLDEQSRQIVCRLDGVKVAELLYGGR